MGSSGTACSTGLSVKSSMLDPGESGYSELWKWSVGINLGTQQINNSGGAFVDLLFQHINTHCEHNVCRFLLQDRQALYSTVVNRLAGLLISDCASWEDLAFPACTGQKV